MRPVDARFPVSQPFGGGATQGVDPYGNDPMAPLVRQYGNYQPYGHAGMDIACPEGTPVYAIAAGTVLWADWGTNLPGDESDAGYRKRWYLYKGFPGIVTVIQHWFGKGVYAHKSAAWMNPGDTVTEGQQIGLSGGTGGVAPHLHVEALVDDSFTTGGGLIYGRTNPEPYFGGLAAAGTITEEDDFMALFATREDFIQAVTDAVEPIARVTRVDTATNVLKKPVPYKDPVTGKDTGQTTTLATMIGFADFQATQTRLNTDAKAVAASIPDSIAQEVIDALSARLAGGK